MALLTIGDQVPAYNRTAVMPLQSDQLCACSNWKKGDPTISPGALSSRSV